METAAVPAEPTTPGPLAALALVVAIPAPFLLALWAWSVSTWGALLVFSAGVGVVLLIGRRSIGVPQALGVTLAASSALGVSSFAWFYIGIFQAIAACNGGMTYSLHASIVVPAAVIYVVLGFWSLRRGWWWGPAFALALALVFGLILTYSLPGVTHPEPCSSD